MRANVKKAFAVALVATTACYNVIPANALTVFATAYEEVVSNVNLISYGAELEAAYVTWDAVENADGYHVYYKEAAADDASYTQLDDQLIRQYTEYYRADMVGLTAGDYTMKVVPLFDGEESETSAETSTLSVSAHDRSGFAFSENSEMQTGSGGYNDDGSVPDDAQIIYITKDNVNTVTLDVISNSKGATTTCTGLVDILAKRQKKYDKRHLIIRMVGLIEGDDVEGLNTKNYLQIKGCYNVTFEGIGEDATLSGWSLLVRDSRNVEIRNIGVMLFKDDGISLDTNNENIWVHNNDIFYGAPGSDADQVKGDGSADVKGKSTNVTISYNHFWDSGKSSLCGMSDTEEFYVTYHHNWFDHSDSRHPRIRVGTIHIYNNYFDGNSKYGVGVTKGSSAFVEANYFRNCKYPMLSSLQGSDIATNSKGSFSGEAGGMIKAYNNMVIGAKALVYASDDSVQFDAYLATSRDEQVSTDYTTVSGGTTYNNFDTDESIMYDYTADAPEDVEDVVTTYAGRMNGGDLQFTFDNSVDDESYAINTELKALLTNYTSDLVSVGGESSSASTDDVTPTETPEVTETPVATTEPTVEPTVAPTTEPTVEPTEEPTEEPTVAPTEEPSVEPTAAPTEEPVVEPTETPDSNETAVYEHNFTESGLTSDFFTITGALSTSKGSVIYNDMTLTTCLKMESNTSIAFTTDSETTLTLVGTEGLVKGINIDETSYSFENGILTVTLSAGSHTITKKDSNVNLYYLSIEK